MSSMKKLIRAVDENKPLAAFLCVVFMAGWQMSVLYSDYLNFKSSAATREELAEVKNDLELLKAVLKVQPMGRNISMTLADREDRIKRCNQSLQKAGDAVNNIFAHHQRCVEREKSIRYANSEAF